MCWPPCSASRQPAVTVEALSLRRALRVCCFQELDKMVDAQAKRLGRENAVTEAFESICTFESYKVYKFSPPKMVKAVSSSVTLGG
eukprot:scaffold900_cov430-Prasinococcus_capsulatus_cf.AAC.12